MVKVFSGCNIVLCKELLENKSLLINNLPGLKVVGVLLPLVFISVGNCF